jgi:hypothetical protein
MGATHASVPNRMTSISPTAFLFPVVAALMVYLPIIIEE